MSRRHVTTLLIIAASFAVIAAILLPPRIGHPVSPWMESKADGSKGRRVTTIPIAPQTPTVVVFVLPTCPCSIQYEPYVQSLYRAYQDQATFVEVVAGTQEEAEAWKQDHAISFPIVIDQDGKIAQEFGAIRSAYTALILDGEIVKLWPGYSADMLRDLGTRISTATKGPTQTLDLEGAPEPMTSGCPL